MAMMVVEREIPIRTVSEANMRSHWAAKAKRVKQHRWAACVLFRVELAKVRLPAVVVLTRLAPSSGLDDDNLASALKATRDGIADAFGLDDRDPRVRWEYRQERSRRGVYAVRVRVMAGPLEGDA